jgi:hypothetical protein
MGVPFENSDKPLIAVVVSGDSSAAGLDDAPDVGIMELLSPNCTEKWNHARQNADCAT